MLRSLFFFKKLAKGGTHSTDRLSDERVHKLVGSGTSMASMKKRPTKKLIDQKVILALIDVAKENGDSEMIKRYWNTWHCFNKVKTDRKRAYGSYCCNRFCSVCCANRKAHLIHQYKPILEKWKNPYFLTLTRVAVKRHELKATFLDNDLKFLRIVNRLQKRHARGKGPKIVALRSTECNYNPVNKTYNPHYHIITQNREIGKLLNIEWLIEHNKQKIKSLRTAGPYGQCLKRIEKEDLEHNLIEVIKYSAKIMTDPDMKKGKKRTNLPIVYAAALYEIHKALSGKKIISKYGFGLLPISKEAQTKELPESQIKSWCYDPNTSQYVDEDTAEVMYKEKFLPSAEVLYLVSERIDKDSK